jgi:predicted  nucleic acid-binding Zn-ribbon protein
MNPYLKQMIDLSEIDNEIAKFEPEIEQVKGDYKKIESERGALVEEISKLNSDISTINSKISESEENLKRMAQQQDEYEVKLKDVTDTKQLSALTIENDIRKEQIQYDNNEIERLNDIKVSLDEKLNDKETNLTEFDSRLSEAEKSLGVKLSAIQENRTKVYIERETLISSMDKKIYSFYGKIRRWAKETTAVPVKNGACYGCFMKLSDQTNLEVIKSEDIVTCPNCGRLLYKEEESEGES